jgi:hypothetical protein
MLVEGLVLLDEFLLVVRYIIKRMDRVGRTDRYAGAAVNAALGIDIHLSRGFEARLVLLGMNAIGGANVDTKRILNARISNYISHDEWISAME